MTSSRRRLATLVIAPLLVVGLAACAGAEPEAMPTLPPTPTPTPTEEAVAAPPSRVPVDCAELGESLEGLDVTTAEPRRQDRSPTVLFDAVLAQAGFIECQIDGRMGETAVSTAVIVGVDVERSMVESWVDSSEQAGDMSNIGGELSSSNCRAEQIGAFCLGYAWSGGYLLSYTITPEGALDADFNPAFLAYASSLGASLDSWPAPAPAWGAPEGVLRWSADCEQEVATTDAAIRAAIPFPVGAPTFDGSGYGFWQWGEAERRTITTSCVWGYDDQSVYIEIVPGAAWYAEQPGVLSGTAYDYPGATLSTIEASSTDASLKLVIGGSFVQVYLRNSSAASSDELTVQARTIADAIVAEFGTP